MSCGSAMTPERGDSSPKLAKGDETGAWANLSLFQDADRARLLSGLNGGGAPEAGGVEAVGVAIDEFASLEALELEDGRCFFQLLNVFCH